MKITKYSYLSHKYNTMDLPVTEDELARHANGEHAQDVWPNMKPEDREFLISGSTPAEWDEWFPRGDCEEGDDE